LNNLDIMLKKYINYYKNEYYIRIYYKIDIFII